MKQKPPDSLQHSIVKREPHGNCNICGTPCKLTWDHLPPSGSTRIQPMEQQTVLQHVATGHGEHRYSISQNGVKFRTLCDVCNNDRLGAQCDPVLIDFTTRVTRNVTSGLTLPHIVHVSTNPSKLIRAIFGHLLAAKGRIENTVPDRQMKAYFLDPNSICPVGLNVFYWLHPYHNVVVIRDVVMPAVRRRFSDKPGMFSILKFFPVGYLVTDLAKYEGLTSLTHYATISNGSDLDLPLNLARVEHPRWPEIVDDGNFLAGGQSVQSSILAKPKGG
jgi:hypothetical protein